MLYITEGRYAEAEQLLKRALAKAEKALGPEHPGVGTRLHNLAGPYAAQGGYAEAEQLLKRALAKAEKALGPEHPDVGKDLNALAAVYFAQGEWDRAADYWRRGTGITISRVRRGTLVVGEGLTGKRESEAEQQREQFWALVKAVNRLAAGNNAGAQRDMFETAQWAQSSEAAEALSQMAARSIKGDPTLVRERQDLVAEYQKRDLLRSAAVARAPKERDAKAEAENNARLAAIDSRIAEIDKQLANFRDYAAFTSPAALSVEDAQAQLGADEALILFLDTPEWKPAPEETFIWVVTKTDVRWVRSELGKRSLTNEVTALRCGLDLEGAWLDENGGWNGARCTDLLKVAYTLEDYKGGKPLPFDLARAHALYKALFGQIEDLINDKRLLIVPSGPLTQLPFQVMVTDEPNTALPSAFADYRDVAGLHANTRLRFCRRCLHSRHYANLPSRAMPANPISGLAIHSSMAIRQSSQTMQPKQGWQSRNGARRRCPSGSPRYLVCMEERVRRRERLMVSSTSQIYGAGIRCPGRRTSCVMWPTIWVSIRRCTSISVRKRPRPR